MAIERMVPSQAEALKILGKLPSVIANTKFGTTGLAITDEGPLSPVYVARWNIFTQPQDETIGDTLTNMGAFVLDPLSAASEFITDEMQDANGNRFLPVKWARLINTTTPLIIDSLLIPRAHFSYVNLDTTMIHPAMADRIRSDIAYMAHYGAVIVAQKNPSMIEGSKLALNTDKGGQYFEGPEAQNDALSYLNELMFI